MNHLKQPKISLNLSLPGGEKKVPRGSAARGSAWFRGFTPLEILKDFSVVKKNNQKFLTGFTLIELLVVIAIIGTLLTLILISFRDANARSRDTRRVMDINTFQGALALYQVQNASYPAQAEEAEIDGSDILSQTLTEQKLLSSVIRDPSYPSTAYKYFYQSDGKTYVIRYCQETNSIRGLSQNCENRMNP